MQKKTLKRWLPRAVLGALLIIGIAATVYYRGHLDVAAIQAWIAQAGAWAAIVFVLAYLVATALFLPGSVFTLAGGALFGPGWGTFYNLTGATLGATLAFLIARYLASDWVERTAGGRVKKLITGVEQEGWRFVAFSRLVPIFPFNLLNYAFGLTRIKFSHYLIATYVCMFPGTLAFTYIGFVGREALSGEQEGLIRNWLIALGLLAVMAFVPRVVKRVRKAPRKDNKQATVIVGEQPTCASHPQDAGR